MDFTLQGISSVAGEFQQIVPGVSVQLGCCTVFFGKAVLQWIVGDVSGP